MLWFWETYCSTKAEREEPYASPLRATDLSGLPNALVVTAEFDPLRDEGEAYAKELEKAGIQVKYKCYEGMVHDFFSTATAFESSRFGLLETIETIKIELS